MPTPKDSGMSPLHPLAPAQHMQAQAHLPRPGYQEPQPVTAHIVSHALHVPHPQRLQTTGHQWHRPQHQALGPILTPQE